MNKITLLILLFIIWRIFLFVPLYFGMRYIPFNAMNAPVQLWAFTRPYPPVSNFLLYPWANFDGVHYLTIAGNGYMRGAEGRFFPFYPFLISLFAALFGQTTIFGIGQFFSAFLIANLSFLASLILFYTMLRKDYSPKIALWTIIFLLVFPTSFFFGSIYTESIFLLFSLASFYFARKKNFVRASILGALLTLTRSVGIFILFPLLYEFIKVAREKPMNKIRYFQAISFFLIPLALLGFMLFNYYQWHDIFYFIHAQEAVTPGRSHLVVFFPQTIYRYVKILLSLSQSQFEWWIALLELTTFFITTLLLFVSWRKHVSLSYLIFAVSCYLIPTISGTLSGFPRYASILFPIFIVPALIKNTHIKIAICVICCLLLFLLTMFFSRGYLVA